MSWNLTGVCVHNKIFEGMKDKFEKHYGTGMRAFCPLVTGPQCVRAFVMCRYFYTACLLMFLEEPVIAGQVLGSFSSSVWFFF